MKQKLINKVLNWGKAKDFLSNLPNLGEKNIN
jgi:hypothetical protein